MVSLQIFVNFVHFVNLVNHLSESVIDLIASANHDDTDADCVNSDATDVDGSDDVVDDDGDEAVNEFGGKCPSTTAAASATVDTLR